MHTISYAIVSPKDTLPSRTPICFLLSNLGFLCLPIAVLKLSCIWNKRTWGSTVAVHRLWYTPLGKPGFIFINLGVTLTHCLPWRFMNIHKASLSTWNIIVLEQYCINIWTLSQLFRLQFWSYKKISPDILTYLGSLLYSMVIKYSIFYYQLTKILKNIIKMNLLKIARRLHHTFDWYYTF